MNKEVFLNIISKKRNGLALLFFLWLVSQVFFLHHFGIVTGLEATKYIDQAHYFLKTGRYTSTQFIFYSTQIFLLVFCFKTGLGYGFAVFVQIILNGLSVYCFYQLIVKLTGRYLLALGGTVFFLLQFYYQLYNVFLFTESIFFSLSVIFMYVLFTVKRMNLKSAAAIFALLLLLYFTRPTAIFLIPSTILYIILKFYPKKTFRLLSLSVIVLIIMYFLLNSSLGAGGEFDFLLPYKDERIICGVPTIDLPHDFQMTQNPNSITGLWYIVTHHFDLFIKLGTQRLMAFFGMVRSYYSLPHNIFIAGYFYVLYLLIIFKIKDLFKYYRAATLFMLSQVGFTAITVMLSCDEWHNRFMFAIFPFILLVAILAFHNLNSVRNKNVQSEAS